MSCTESPADTVLHLGPPAGAVGGMASVVEQIARMDFRGRYRVAVLPATSAPKTREAVWRKPARHLSQLGRLHRDIRAQDVRLVHIHTCSGFSFYRSLLDALIARAHRRQVVLHIHGAAFDDFYKRSTRWSRPIIRWGLASADAVIALSAAWQHTLRTIAPRARVVVIENAVEPPGNATATPDASHDAPCDGPVEREKQRTDGQTTPCRFLLLARMDEWKGVDDLLAASRILHQQGVRFSVTLAGPPGTAGDAPRLNAKIAQLGLEKCVRYVGPVYGRDKERLLAATDVYVQPSHHEGMPIAVLEALAHGLPVVGARVGAVPEVITHGEEGLLIPPRAPQRLAEAMVALARDDDARRKMSEAALRLVRRRFSIQRFRDDLIQLYDALLTRTVSRSDVSTPQMRRMIDAPRPRTGQAVSE